MAMDSGLRVRVQTQDGWAVQHAILTVADVMGSQVLRASAGDDGVVRTEPLPQGAYMVIVTAVGYQPTASTVIVPASGRADLGNLVLARQGGVELPPPGTWTIDPAHSSIGATAQHLGISSVRGRFTQFRGQIEIADNVRQSQVDVTITAASIDTGNAMRDGHLRSADFLHVDAHPEITYRSTGDVTPASPDRWMVRGELTMNALTRPVDLDVTYLGTGPDPWGGTRTAFRATTELQREDFAMNYNEVLRAGIAVIGTTLRVELDIQAAQGSSLPTD
jgi:polyisoprenoid-binding protein YceI